MEAVYGLRFARQDREDRRDRSGVDGGLVAGVRNENAEAWFPKPRRNSSEVCGSLLDVERPKNRPVRARTGLLEVCHLRRLSTSTAAVTLCSHRMLRKISRSRRQCKMCARKQSENLRFVWATTSGTGFPRLKRDVSKCSAWQKPAWRGVNGSQQSRPHQENRFADDLPPAKRAQGIRGTCHICVIRHCTGTAVFTTEESTATKARGPELKCDLVLP